MNSFPTFVASPSISDAATIATVGQIAFSRAFSHLFPPESLEKYLKVTWSEGKIASSLRKPNNRYLVVWSNGTLVGMIKSKIHCSNPAVLDQHQHQLQKMYILPEYQNRGLGTLLLQTMMNVESHIHGTWWLQVHSGNKSAKRFYQRHGFVECHEDTIQLVGVPIDFVVMTRTSSFPTISAPSNAPHVRDL